ncbi:hypothetical protein B6N60_04082 [Richelia sinica FACHB-800]|uniref:Uncharacterized protein n=1 Tax=Richelia sinica FACHB-800 TaxID=1357546 RepID=A0A975TAS5_9NOST|nr:hypothetical protein [Richelia sinica]QXE25368.1 hypothetical protein B6N60_04082 [Richelia sinica FACHB-800]
MDIPTILLTALITWAIEKSADEFLFWVKKNLKEKSSDNNEDN